MNITVRVPDAVYKALKRYREKEKPHLSQNALIVEAISLMTGKKPPKGKPAAAVPDVKTA